MKYLSSGQLMNIFPERSAHVSMHAAPLVVDDSPPHPFPDPATGQESTLPLSSHPDPRRRRLAHTVAAPHPSPPLQTVGPRQRHAYMGAGTAGTPLGSRLFYICRRLCLHHHHRLRRRWLVGGFPAGVCHPAAVATAGAGGGHLLLVVPRCRFRAPATAVPLAAASVPAGRRARRYGGGSVAGTAVHGLG